MRRETWRDFAGTVEGKTVSACGIKGPPDSNDETARESVGGDGNGRSAKIEAKRRAHPASSA